MVRIHGLKCNLPSVINALREMQGGFDVDVHVLRNGLVALTRLGHMTVLVNRYGWFYSLHRFGVLTGIDSYASDQLQHIVRTLTTPIAGGMFCNADVDENIAMMKPFIVAPTTVPSRIARKFPLGSEYVQRCLDTWLEHSESKFSAYFGV